MVKMSSILIYPTKINNMIIINKITGRDVTKEYLGLMEGVITNKEFETITLTPQNLSTCELYN
ncbi:MAG: hypothetical protein GOVbin15_62 [Prokaryotic dsDNA virus sp.]|nr:MAG: hypothetical protein GOVbin15_62 [Prokaryotic dsDNA virus sp.]|tara:strand:+ start:51313 stop:51501 length:189 start_codon:yes stop_codon:yes gene_type:complete